MKNKLPEDNNKLNKLPFFKSDMSKIPFFKSDLSKLQFFKNDLSKLPFFKEKGKSLGTATISRELPGFLKLINANLTLLSNELKRIRETSKELVSTSKVISTSTEKTTKQITEVNETSSGEQEAKTEKDSEDKDYKDKQLSLLEKLVGQGKDNKNKDKANKETGGKGSFIGDFIKSLGARGLGAGLQGLGKRLPGKFGKVVGGFGAVTSSYGNMTNPLNPMGNWGTGQLAQRRSRGFGGNIKPKGGKFGKIMGMGAGALGMLGLGSSLMGGGAEEQMPETGMADTASSVADAASLVPTKAPPAKIAQTAVGKIPKGGVMSKIGKKVAGGKKVVGKVLGKIGGKLAGTLGKSLLKKIPGIGLLAGLAFGASRLMGGDWKGALGEVASGAASTIPGIGTAASVAIDAGLMAKDIASENADQTPEDPKTGNDLPEPKDLIADATTGDSKNLDSLKSGLQEKAKNTEEAVGEIQTAKKDNTETLKSAPGQSGEMKKSSGIMGTLGSAAKTALKYSPIGLAASAGSGLYNMMSGGGSRLEGGLEKTNSKEPVRVTIVGSENKTSDINTPDKGGVLQPAVSPAENMFKTMFPMLQGAYGLAKKSANILTGDKNTDLTSSENTTKDTVSLKNNTIEEKSKTKPLEVFVLNQPKSIVERAASALTDPFTKIFGESGSAGSTVNTEETFHKATRGDMEKMA